MSILLLRHGETALNAARVVQPADTPLSARGLEQAEALADRLARERVAAILSSDLPRARQTADALARRNALPVQDSVLLQERNFGVLRGQAYDTLGFDPLHTDDAPPGGESAVQFAQRAQQAFELMLRLHDGLDGDLAVFTHGLLIRVLLAGPLQWPMAAGFQLANTSVSIFDATPPYAPRLVNCTVHLDAALGSATRSLAGA